ncbi:MAG: NAD(P)H-dependent oxidoreductase subunit E [Oscillospiraceae bacterium]|jgi:NADH-quinone oxidoreductase subunit E|nr:NAD(P)H-dependent oxidoreductase subunit E [Oscillospiraceae bacterium]
MTSDTTDFSAFEPILAEYGSERGSLITILQKAQELYGFISEPIINYISEQTGIKPAKIFGVATFYAQFRLTPVGKYLIMLCKGTACHVNGSDEVRSAITQYLQISDGETTSDGLFTLNTVSCLGCCSLAPVMMLQTPDGEETFGNLNREKVWEILNSIIQKEQGGATQ